MKNLFVDRPGWALFALRVGMGLAMLTHGLPKLMAFQEKAAKFADPFGLGSTTSLALAVFAEVVCSVLLILGIKVRLAAIPLLITMLVAFFMIHGQDPWARRELAALYGLGYISLILGGGGRLSLRN